MFSFFSSLLLFFLLSRHQKIDLTSSNLRLLYGHHDTLTTCFTATFSRMPASGTATEFAPATAKTTAAATAVDATQLALLATITGFFAFKIRTWALDCRLVAIPRRPWFSYPGYYWFFFDVITQWQKQKKYPLSSRRVDPQRQPSTNATDSRRTNLSLVKKTTLYIQPFFSPFSFFPTIFFSAVFYISSGGRFFFSGGDMIRSALQC